MGILRLTGYMVKWTATTLVVGWLTYLNHDRINRFVNNTNFYFTEAESGFVSKNHAFDLKFIYERNGGGNLETFVQNYSDSLPVYMRNSGVMVGAADYNFSNFTSDERSRLCSSPLNIEIKFSTPKNSNNDNKKKLLNALLGLIGE